MSESALRRSAADYYAAKLAEHGPTPRGVDWNGTDSQHLRFRQLLKVTDADPQAMLGDYGCGYGALLEFARGDGFAGEFRGYDAAPAMVAVAQERYGADAKAVFGDSPAVLAGCKFVVASGVFNVKQDADPEAWEEYVFATLDEIAGVAPGGFAFNALTSYSDADKMRPDLYYPDPCRLFDRCKRRYSRNVALLHDYGLWEFTILVRREGA